MLDFPKCDLLKFLLSMQSVKINYCAWFVWVYNANKDGLFKL